LIYWLSLGLQNGPGGVIRTGFWTIYGFRGFFDWNFVRSGLVLSNINSSRPTVWCKNNPDIFSGSWALSIKPLLWFLSGLDIGKWSDFFARLCGIG
jgi:hypothetical protein